MSPTAPDAARVALPRNTRSAARSWPSALAGGLLLLAVACDRISPPGMGGGAAAAPAPVPPAPTAEATPPATAPSDPTAVEFLGLRGSKPATWVWRAPVNPMRIANYTVPGQGEADAGEVIVFYFGPGQGGSLDANIERWEGQFRGPEDKPVKATTQSLQVDGMNVTLVELAGEYMPMGQTWYTPDQLFITAVLDAPAGSVFIRLTGPSQTVEANREAFMGLVRGLKRVE